MDIAGRDPLEAPATILSRMIRRVDGASRWCGMALQPELRRDLSLYCKTLEYDVRGLRPGRHLSQNRHAQQRMNPVINGAFQISGDLTPVWPLLQIAERCHIGRHAVEGLGEIRLETTRTARATPM